MPTPVITNTNLGWAFQTEFVNLVKTSSGFMKKLLFGDRFEALPTESVELSYMEGERYLAPFVEVNGEAISVGGRSTTFANVSCPNIRIKRPMDAYNVFNRRLPNTGMFITGGAQVAAARLQAIAEDSLYMAELIENREEWMVCQMATDTTSGTINLSYQASEKANFKVSIPRSTDMVVTLATTARWNDSAPDIQGDFHNVKRTFSKHLSAPAKTCVMGSAAATSFMKNTTVQALLDKKNISAGALTLVNQFEKTGAIYLGNLFGVDCWEYSREIVNDSGAAEALIASDKAIFIAGEDALAQNKFFYGCIPDHGAFEQGSFVGRRFSKSWMEQDPSVYVQLLQSRPLPMIRKPNAIMVYDVQ